MVTAIIFDTEVNSLDHKECIELAYSSFQWNETAETFEASQPITERFNPSHPIDAAAVAVHYIMPEQVRDCRPSSEATVPQVDYLIAHKVDFDAEVLGIMWGKRICTLALCQHLWPEFKSHKLSTMFLELNGITADNVNRIKLAHSAKEDVEILTNVIGHILQKTGIKTLPELYSLSEIARVPVIWTFGKHKGTKIVDSPRSYIEWMMRQSDVDQYLMKALKAAL